MKYIIVLCLYSYSCFSQTEPTKGVTQIIIKDSLSASENYKSTINILLDYGFSIDIKDPEYGLIKTQIKPIKGSGNFFLNIRNKDNEIIITGMVNAGMDINLGIVVAKDEYSQITYRGMKGSILMKAFEAMNVFAANIKGEIEYK